jgi:EmrB/QacA subfamily drug resistance transporter
VEAHPQKKLVLAAMIFAVAMTFIDQTIVSIAVPELQKDLDLTSTGVQWVINGYLLSLAALFAFGGKLADIAGHTRMLVIGVILFAVSSALCGATPEGDLAEPWIITFRVLEGAGAALMFPAALAIVVSSFPLHERGKAMAIFFAVAGGLTALGPIAGGYLSEWTWRSIFWVNIPVAIIALILTAKAKPPNQRNPQPLDYRGLVLVTGGMALAVFGLQQAATWGWDDPKTIGSIAVGLVLLTAFIRLQLRTENPLLQLRFFKDRGFATENAILFVMNIVFIPMFFFASMYSQLSLGDDASNAGLYLVIFFGGYAAASQRGGHLLDAVGARAAIVPGTILAAVGYYFWAQNLTDLSLDAQWPFIVMAGVGMGLILGPASTDALNRVPPTSYGEATGIEQTVRNFGASLGLAIMGTVLIHQNTKNIESSLAEEGISTSEADKIASAVNGAGGGDTSSFSEQGGSKAVDIFHTIQHDFAQASEVVFTIMAGVMVVAFIIAIRWMPRGRVDDPSAGE